MPFVVVGNGRNKKKMRLVSIHYTKRNNKWDAHMETLHFMKKKKLK